MLELSREFTYSTTPVGPEQLKKHHTPQATPHSTTLLKLYQGNNLGRLYFLNLTQVNFFQVSIQYTDNFSYNLFWENTCRDKGRRKYEKIEGIRKYEKIEDKKI
jgi:hypothetical protein